MLSGIQKSFSSVCTELQKFYSYTVTQMDVNLE